MITLSLIICLVGAIIYLVVPPTPDPRNPRIIEIGRLMFGIGLLAYLLQVVHVFGNLNVGR